MSTNETAPDFSLYAKLLFGERAAVKAARTATQSGANSSGVGVSGDAPTADAAAEGAAAAHGEAETT